MLQNDGPSAPPSPASQGMGAPPSMPGLMPPPSGKGAVPTGGAGGTKLTAAGDAIAALKNLVGFVPELGGSISALMAQIKEATKKDAQPSGPAVGQPGVPGSAQMDSSVTMDSGAPGPM
jgi:hypothetical protein